MQEVQCPNCEKDAELENDSLGLFDCPYCDEEFEYESSNDNAVISPMAKPKGLLSNSTPEQRFFTFFFILGASFFGTNPRLLFTGDFFWEGFVQTWLVSFLADIVFILTMTISFLYVWKRTDSAKTKTSYFLMPLITPFVVFIGYAISWFLICLRGPDFSDRTPNFGFFQFMFPIGSPDFEYMWGIIGGYNGLIFTTIYTAIVVFNNTDTPKASTPF